MRLASESCRAIPSIRTRPRQGHCGHARRRRAAAAPIADYSRTAPPRSPNCHLSYGSRFKLEQSGEAVFDCYAQELPAVDHTLGYGQTQTVGAITCASEPSAMTCADGSTGHYFRISREAYEVG